MFNSCLFLPSVLLQGGAESSIVKGLHDRVGGSCLIVVVNVHELVSYVHGDLSDCLKGLANLGDWRNLRGAANIGNVNRRLSAAPSGGGSRENLLHADCFNSRVVD